MESSVLRGVIVFISLEQWDEIWRRNQFLCVKLVERNPELKILFVEPSLDVSNALRTGRAERILQRRKSSAGVEGRIVCTRPLKFFPNSWTWTRRINEGIARRGVLSLLRKLGWGISVLWVNAHGAVHMVGQMSESAMIYDVTDDWTQFPETPAALALIKAQDRELCMKANAVIVCSKELHQLKAPLTRKIHLIPNGVDASHYATALDNQLPIPAEARDWKRPVLGYTGTVHPDRVDVFLVEAIAKRLPDCTLAFVGPQMLPPKDSDRLKALPNVVLVGPRPYERMPEYMRVFDICITPHLVTPFTESLNPIKLWDYLAVGKPIISTPVAGFRDYPEFVYLARNAEEFAQAVRESLQENTVLPERRRAEAAKHSWDRRVEAVEDVINQCCARVAVAA